MARKYKKEKGRSTQRHRALDVLFEADEKNLLSEEGILHLLEDRQEISTAQVPIGEFGSSIVEAYARHISNVDTLIEAASEDWAMDRMNGVDRNILRGATAEFIYLDTPRSALVPEWANLARSMSTERSVGFVMGVLNRVADIRERELAGGEEPAGEQAPEEVSDAALDAEGEASDFSDLTEELQKEIREGNIEILSKNDAVAESDEPEGEDL